MEAFELAVRKTKGFYVSSCKAGSFPSKKETGRYIKLPGNIQESDSYGGFAWKKNSGCIRPEKVCPQKKKVRQDPAEMFFEIPLSGILECPLGIFSSRKFLYKIRRLKKKSIRNGWIMIK